MRSLELVLPDDLTDSMTDAELQALAQEALVVRLYELEKIGSGRAANLLGLTRRSFLDDVLGRYGLTAFDENVDLLTEAARG